jgi:hypothetical protein
VTAFWLTWKPEGWPLEKLQDLVRRVRADPSTTEPWRIQAPRRVSIVSRVFLFRQGPGPRGIFGVGEVADFPRQIPEESKDPDAPQFFAPIRFFMLEDPTQKLLLPLEGMTDVVPAALIGAQASGTTLSDDLAATLEKRIGLNPAIWKVNPKSLTNRDAVLETLREFDRLGRDAFLRVYGFGPSREDKLLHDGRRNDSKAIVGVAFKLQDGFRRPFGPRAFSSGADTVKKVLERLGFTVTVEGANAGNQNAIPPGLSDDGDFDPGGVEDARTHVLRAIAARRGQGKFRDALIEAYGGRCAFSGCAVTDVLEAAHITPYLGEATNDLSNGLLLRADLHTLFDAGLISVDPLSMEITLAASIRNSDYFDLHGRMLRPRIAGAVPPSSKALKQHWEESGF